MEFTEEDVRSLVTKLEALELSTGERAALDLLYAAASDDDATGFSIDFDLSKISLLGEILSNVSKTRSEISMTFARNARA